MTNIPSQYQVWHPKTPSWLPNISSQKDPCLKFTPFQLKFALLSLRWLLIKYLNVSYEKVEHKNKIPLKNPFLTDFYAMRDKWTTVGLIQIFTFTWYQHISFTFSFHKYLSILLLAIWSVNLWEALLLAIYCHLTRHNGRPVFSTDHRLPR